MNDDFARINETNIIKEICSKLYDKISSKILNNKIFINEEIKDYISNEQAEEFIYLIIRMDCVLNYFGSFSDNFISQLNFIKFQILIFNLITFFRSKVQSNISERTVLFEKKSILNAEGISSNIIQNEKNKDFQYKYNELDESAKNLELEFNNNEYFLQNFTNYGFKLIKSLNLILLTKIIFNIDSISNENNVSLSDSIQNPSQNNNNMYNVNKNEASHYYQAYLKYINILFNNFENFIRYEFNYSSKNNSSDMKKLKLEEEFNKFVQEKNYLNLEIKSNFLCLILEIIIYISSEKLDIYSSNCDLRIKFQLNDSILITIEKFLKKEFVFLFQASSKKLKEINDEIRTIEIQQENEDLEEENEIDKLELLNNFKKNIENVISIRTLFLKNICESFSKLLIQNLGMFKNRNLITLFFESFYLIKYPVIIESINNIVFGNLLEKEISYYLKDEENNKINWMIFYFSKISVKLFSKKSSLFNFLEYLDKKIENNESTINVCDDKLKQIDESLNQNTFNFYDFFDFNSFSLLENYQFRTKKNDSSNLILINDEEKFNMLKRFFEVYLKTQRKIKNSYSKDFSQSIENKDKKFLEEFICKSFNYALQSKITKEIEVENIADFDNELELNNEIEENSTEKKLTNIHETKFEKHIYIENIKFLDLIKHILKNSSFITETEYKTFLMLFVKLVKNIESTDNVNRADIKKIETMKSYLLNKAKLYANKEEDKAEEKSEEESEEENEENNDKKEKTNKKKKETKTGFNKKNTRRQKGEVSESEEENQGEGDTSKNLNKNKNDFGSQNEDDSDEESGKNARNKNKNMEIKKDKRSTLKKKNKKDQVSKGSLDISDKVGKKRIHEDVRI